MRRHGLRTCSKKVTNTYGGMMTVEEISAELGNARERLAQLKERL